MNRKNLFSYSAFLLIIIFILNAIAGKLYWYSSIWYFDIIMHFLGGFWLGTIFFWIFYNKILPNFPKNIFFHVILGVFLVGFIWELYEILVNAYLAKNTFDLADTVGDLIDDILGGFTSYLLIRYIIKNN